MPLLTTGNPLFGTVLRDYFLPTASDTIHGWVGDDRIVGDYGPVVTAFGVAGLHEDGRSVAQSIDDPALWSTRPTGLMPTLNTPFATLFAAPPAGSHLWYSVTLGAGETLQVYSSVDTVFGLYDENGTELIDFNLENPVPIDWTATVSGTYFIRAMEFSATWPPWENDGGVFEGDEEFLLFVTVSGHAAAAPAPTLPDDLVRGGAGNDHVLGETGSDTLHGNPGNDTMQGGLGDDWLHGGNEHDALSGGTGNDVLIGGAGNDMLLGEEGADSLSGGLGNDLLRGGDDVLAGGGADILTGGLGADRFIWTALDFGAGLRTGADRITDFSETQGDRIDLSAIDANPSLAGNNAFSFIGAAAFSATRGKLRFAHEGGNTFIEGDRSGDGRADFVIRLDGLITLTAADFVL